MKKLFKNIVMISIMLFMNITTLIAMEALQPSNPATQERKPDEITIGLADSDLNIKKSQLEDLVIISKTIKNTLKDYDPIAKLDEFDLSTLSSKNFNNLLTILPQLIILKKATGQQAKQTAHELIIFIKESMRSDEIIELIRAANFLEIEILIDNGLSILAFPKDINDQEKYTAFIKEITDTKIMPQDLWNNMLQKADLNNKYKAFLEKKMIEYPTEFKGHVELISSVAISPDGLWIVTGSYDNTAKIWDRKTGKELLTLRGHTEPISSVAISPDGNWIVTGSLDKTAKIWDRKTGNELRTLSGHKSIISSVAISPKGKWIVTGSVDKTAKIWDRKTGNELLALSGHTGPIFSVAISPNGKWVVTGSEDKTAKIWDRKTGNELRTLSGHTEPISSIAISPDGKWIVTGSLDKTLKIWDSKTGNELKTITGYTEPIFSVAISPDGNWIVTGSADNNAKIWYIVNSSIDFNTMPHDQILLIEYLLEEFMEGKKLSIEAFMQKTYKALPGYFQKMFNV